MMAMALKHQLAPILFISTLLWVIPCFAQVNLAGAPRRKVNATDHGFQAPRIAAFLNTADKLHGMFREMGDHGKIYEAQFHLMKQGRVVPDKLLVKLKEKTESKKPLASTLFGKLLGAVERAANMTGSQRAAAHIARFKDLAEMAVMGANEVIDMLKEKGIEGLEELYYGVQSGVCVLGVEKGHNITDMWMKVLQLPEVEFAEPDLLVELSATYPNCPVGSDWGLFHSNSHGAMNLLASSDDRRSKDSEVVVAVIDSGVDIYHALLEDRIWVNEAEKNGVPGVDDDNNGYVDDIYGWNFGDNNPDVMDTESHGTHVAGIISAGHSITPRFQGLAPNAKLLPCKFVSSETGGSVSTAVQCLEYAWLMGADITSNSWGVVGAYSLSLMSALRRAEESDILTVASAGNDGIDNDPEIVTATFPASFDLDSVLSVAAVDDQGRLAYGSNFGRTSVDIGAPGVQITSTIPNNEFGEKSGTSMAAPFVSGAAALLLGLCREQGKACTALDVKNALLSSADRTGDLDGLVKADGYLNTLGAAQRLGLLYDGNNSSKPSPQDCASNASQRQNVPLLLVGAGTWLLYSTL